MANHAVTVQSDPGPMVQETQFISDEVMDEIDAAGLASTPDHNSDDEQNQDRNPASNDTSLDVNNNMNTTTHSRPQSQPQQQQSPPLATTTIKPARLLSPDLLRGLLMTLQAIDHSAMSAGAWPHGTALISESDSVILSTWNKPTPWTARMLTHLCAPGFMFLLGMGVVYFGTSRMKLGWEAGRMVRHFFIRGVVLAGVNQVLGWVLLGRVGVVVLNIVLLALAVDYFVVGVGWLGVRWVEGRLGEGFERVLDWREKGRGRGGGGGEEGGEDREGGDDGDGERQPLLVAVGGYASDSKSNKANATLISFHVVNVFLLVLVGVTLWWNVWFSPTHGHCPGSVSSITPDPTPTTPPSPIPTSSASSNIYFEFLFHPLNTPTLISAFPPLAWISFAILGVLYARILLIHQRSTTRINLVNLLLGLTFLSLFVSTRLFHFGNLEEGCLRTPEQSAHPDKNQYLAGGVRSFTYVTKYPPSPSFAFYSMGLNFLFLAAFGFVPLKMAGHFPFNVLLAFGTCALFFYAVHLPLYGVLGGVVKAVWGREMDWKDDWGRNGDWAIGVPLGVFWFDWAGGLVVLWGLCRWYGGFKRGKGVDSVWRFF